MSIRHRLLETLADGRFHSGEALGAKFGMSRAAIWKQLKQIEKLGLEIYAVPGKGYRLARALELLDQERIEQHLGLSARQLLAGLCIFQNLNSTNGYLLEGAGKGMASGQVCLAERQTAGRGRRGRKWVSPFGGNLYASFLWRFSCAPHWLEGLGLAMGVALVRALRRIGLTDAKLKWPNDVFWQERKLAGILLEMSGEPSGPCCVVVGIGVNISMACAESQEIDQPWVDLDTSVGAAISRNYLAALVIDEVLPAMSSFEEKGLNDFLAEWRKYDAVYGKSIVLRSGTRQQEGIAVGIDHVGALLVNTGNEIQRFYSGDVSLRFTA